MCISEIISICGNFHEIVEEYSKFNNIFQKCALVQKNVKDDSINKVLCQGTFSDCVRAYKEPGKRTYIEFASKFGTQRIDKVESFESLVESIRVYQDNTSVDEEQINTDINHYDYLFSENANPNDDIEVDDVQVKGFFDRITEFLEGRSSQDDIYEDREISSADEECTPMADAKPEFDISTAKRKTVTHPMSEMMISNRKIDDLMSQMDETFSQRLLRMIRERGMTEADAYKKAYVDRRHFSKIKKDEYYMPNRDARYVNSLI